MKKVLCTLLMGFIVAVIAMPITVYGCGGGQAGTTLCATVSVKPHWTVTYRWTIDKSVTPDSWEFTPGDSGTSIYTITVTKDGCVEEAWISGKVCVKNGGSVATQNLAITVIVKNGYEPPNDFLTSASVDVSAKPVLNPGEKYCYNFKVDIPITGGSYPQPHAGGAYKVTAKVTIKNHSGHLGNPYGPSPSATTKWPASATLVNDVIHVDDTNGGSWEFSQSGSVTYERTFRCTNVGEHVNTATIRETGQSDSATVTVICRETPTVPEFQLELPLIITFGAMAAYMVRRRKLSKAC